MELGNWLDQAATGRGAGTIACRDVVDHAALRRGADELDAGVTHGNEACIAVLRRLGFIRVRGVAGRGRCRALAAHPHR